MPCFDANASARLRSRAATATIWASVTLRAGLIAALGAMRAAPRIPIRTGAMRPDATPRPRNWSRARLRRRRSLFDQRLGPGVVGFSGGVARNFSHDVQFARQLVARELGPAVCLQGIERE